MRNVSWLAAAGLVMITAGCVEQGGYPTTYGYSPGYGSQGYSSPGYGYSGYSNNYYSQPSYSQPSYYRPQPTYYSQPVVVTQPRYVPVANSTPRRGPNGDYDRDGIPNRYDRDKNGDGVPDRYQRNRY
jgi:hypothetical protein